MLTNGDAEDNDVVISHLVDPPPLDVKRPKYSRGIYSKLSKVVITEMEAEQGASAAALTAVEPSGETASTVGTVGPVGQHASNASAAALTAVEPISGETARTFGPADQHASAAALTAVDPNGKPASTVEPASQQDAFTTALTAVDPSGEIPNTVGPAGQGASAAALTAVDPSAVITATSSKTAAPSSLQLTPLVTTGGASAAGTSNSSAAATPTGGSGHGLKRPMLPGPGIDALLAAGIALDLSMKAQTMEATRAALAAPSQQQKQPAAYASGLLRSAATVPASGHELQLQARTKRLPGPAIKGRAPAPAAPSEVSEAALEILANIDVEDKPFISTRRRQPHQAPSITLRPTGLPVLPDLELISTGPAGVVKILLQVIHLLHLPSQLKIDVLKYARGLLSSPGTYGRDFMDVLYTYLQVGCEHGDVGALEYVFSEICGSDDSGIDILELLHKDLISALQARLDVQVMQDESSLPLEQDEGAGGVEEFRAGEGNMHLVSETEAAAMKVCMNVTSGCYE
ncbi:hypothetical protein CEUSTIGMA_g3103.t1 [Chlamydomonas eustigma]|uniref:Uncharacterized protein n=1 Tax=Chlamydomonas eustigma TaxID=1157962 RepID=A0A250WY88_9CHLO|nr:hypothetical protein CEUSTIGMA_g3103.t1 [Chlamydomonas eustigma]|eukprot:GAX75659.1 hypothetical protein CEUSTIGMA_g3103.t1 [Chlamydomonas eustigma]